MTTTKKKQIYWLSYNDGMVRGWIGKWLHNVLFWYKAQSIHFFTGCKTSQQALGDKCLDLGKPEKPFKDARKDCREKKGDLVTILNARTNIIVQVYLKRKNVRRAYIGLDDINQEGEWHEIRIIPVFWCCFIYVQNLSCADILFYAPNVIANSTKYMVKWNTVWRQHKLKVCTSMKLTY